MVATTRHPDGTVETQGYMVNGQSSFTNKFIDAVSQQFHGIIDSYVPADINVMDSVLAKRLNDRYIYPDFIMTEVVDSIGDVVIANTKEPTHASMCFLIATILIPAIFIVCA